MAIKVWPQPVRDLDPVHSGKQNGPATHREALAALMEDVITARHGTLVQNEGGIFSSDLKEPADAVVASRQIQFGVQGLRTSRGEPTAVSIVLDFGALPGKAKAAAQPGSESESAQEPPVTSLIAHDVVTLLDQAKPAQVLLTHDLYQRLNDFGVLPTKAHPGRFGVFEYLWTSENRLEFLQAQPELTLAALPASVSSAPDTRSTSVNAPASAAAGKAGDVHSNSQWQSRLGQLVATPKRSAVAGAVGLALLLLLFGGIRAVFAPRKPRQVPAAAAPAATQSTLGIQASPVIAVPVPPPSTIQPKSHTKNIAEGKDRKNQKTASPQQTPTPSCVLSGDLSAYTSLAERRRVSGDYKDAARIFSQVLACEPENSAARLGLDRTLQGERQYH